MDTGKAYLGNVPLFTEIPIFIDGDGKKYYEKDCHIFIANGKVVNLPIPSGTLPKFVAVNGEDVTPTSFVTRTIERKKIGADGVRTTSSEEIQTTAIPANDGDTIHAIFDWDNSSWKSQGWFSDILQIGSRSVGDEPEGYVNPTPLPSGRIPNQLKNGEDAFIYIETNSAAISNLDTSNLTSMSGMFFDAPHFNSDISKWNTSNVTEMRYMFENGSASKDYAFNSDISKWDTSKVTNMGTMFYGALSFNQDISKWNTSNVTEMSYMFDGAESFNSDISEWDVSKVTTMSNMFEEATSFNQDISKWNTSNVTNMGNMFRLATAFDVDISKWDVSNVKDMQFMFDGAPSFNSDISKWNTSKVTNMRYMFRDAISFNSDISQWDTSKVTNMRYMFNGAEKFNQDLSQWCVSEITEKPYNFDAGAGFAGQTDKQPQWGTCPREENIPIPDDYSIEDCHIFVANGSTIILPIPSGTLPTFVSVNGVDATPTTFTTHTVEREEIGEDGATTTTTEEIEVAEISANNGDTVHAIFDWNNRNFAKQLWFHDILQFGSRSVGDEPEGYVNPTPLPSGKIPNQLKNAKYAFYYMGVNPDIISTLDVSNVTNMGSMFYSAAFNSDISGWDTSNVTDMASMFNKTSTFNQDISKWNTSKVKSMNQMFYVASRFYQDLSQWCVSLIGYKPSSFDTNSAFAGQTDKQPQWNTCPRGEDGN